MSLLILSVAILRRKRYLLKCDISTRENVRSAQGRPDWRKETGTLQVLQRGFTKGVDATLYLFSAKLNNSTVTKSIPWNLRGEEGIVQVLDYNTVVSLESLTKILSDYCDSLVPRMTRPDCSLSATDNMTVARVWAKRIVFILKPAWSTRMLAQELSRFEVSRNYRNQEKGW